MIILEGQEELDFLEKLWDEEYWWQSKKHLYKYSWETKTIQIEKIIASKPKSISKAKRYLGMMQEGTGFPPIVVIKRKNAYRLIDGFHRLWAMKKAEKKEVIAIVGTKIRQEKNQIGEHY